MVLFKRRTCLVVRINTGQWTVKSHCLHRWSYPPPRAHPFFLSPHLHPPLSTPPSFSLSLPLLPTADFQTRERNPSRYGPGLDSAAAGGFKETENAKRALRSASVRDADLSSVASAISSERLAAVLKLTLQTSLACVHIVSRSIADFSSSLYPRKDCIYLIPDVRSK